MPSTPVNTSASNPRPSIGELLVVEGKTDANRLALLVDADFYCTNGFCVSDRTITDIQNLSKGRGVLLFLDNDSAGERIRRRLQDSLPHSTHAYISEPWGKLGQVALASDAEIFKALANVSRVNRSVQSLSWAEYLDLGLSAADRLRLCKRVGISFCNGKQFFKRINMMGLKGRDLLEFLDGRI